MRNREKTGGYYTNRKPKFSDCLKLTGEGDGGGDGK